MFPPASVKWAHLSDSNSPPHLKSILAQRRLDLCSAFTIVLNAPPYRKRKSEGKFNCYFNWHVDKSWPESGGLILSLMDKRLSKIRLNPSDINVSFFFFFPPNNDNVSFEILREAEKKQFFKISP